MRRIARAGVTLALCGVAALGLTCRKSEPAAQPAPAPQAQAPAPQAPAPQAPAPQAPAPEAAASFKVVRVDLGNAVGADKKVSTPAHSFKPKDTIYASILTEGAAPGTLVARWMFEDGQLVNEATQAIAVTGPAATEFHIAKPDGFPAGKYKVEIVANGRQAGVLEFTVAE